jgi:hypothetical protein
MRPDIDRLVEGQRRDLELGAALAALPQPELPDDVDLRLRAVVEKERRRNRRRPGWPELMVVVVIVAAIAAPFAWRYLPPSSSTTDQVRAVMETRRKYAIPTPPQPAIARGRMTAEERVRLEREVARSIAATCTPRFALHEIVDDHLPRHAVQTSAGRLAEGGSWPAPAVIDMPVGEPALVRRNWNGSIVIRFGQDEEVGDLYVFSRIDGRWLIDEVIHRGA